MSRKKLIIDAFFGTRLGRFIEEKSGLSQNKFAEKIGVSQGYLSLVIRGERGPSAEMIAGLFIHYGNKLFYLLTGSAEPSHNAVLFALDAIEQASTLLLEKQKDIMSRESEGLYGITQVVDLDGQRFSVTEYGPENLPAETAELLRLLGMTIRILKSRTPFSQSLAMNIKSFHAAVKMAEKWKDGEKNE